MEAPVDIQALNDEGRALWDQKADFWDSLHGDDGNRFHRLLVSPAVERLLALQPGERVLDVACGTGAVTRLAAQRVGTTGTVTGIDLNPGMLAVARSATPPEMAIEWHQTSAESMPLPDDAFDVVLCQLGLQFMPDKLAALQEMRRVYTELDHSGGDSRARRVPVQHGRAHSRRSVARIDGSESARRAGRAK